MAHYPVIPGHEWSGDVVAVGEAVTRVQVGDRVVGEACTSCGTCADCLDGLGPPFCAEVECYGLTGASRPGSLAEYIVVRERAVHRLPDGVSYEEGTLVEPLSVSYYAIWGVGGGVAPHDRVAIFGAGPIGLLAMLTCKAASAPVIVVEPSAYRRKLALQLGADVVIDPLEVDPAEQIVRHTEGRGATLVLECSANERAASATLHAVATGGRIVLVGMKDGPDVPLALIQTQFKRAQLLGSQGAPFFFPKVLAFVSLHAADLIGIVTHRLPLADIVTGFELGAQGTDCGKILIDCTQTE